MYYRGHPYRVTSPSPMLGGWWTDLWKGVTAPIKTLYNIAVPEGATVSTPYGTLNRSQAAAQGMSDEQFMRLYGNQSSSSATSPLLIAGGAALAAYLFLK